MGGLTLAVVCSSVRLLQAQQAAPAAGVKILDPAVDLDDTKDPPGMRRLMPGGKVWLDPKNKRVVMTGEICLREGQLEMFACLKGTKEHEAILASDAEPRQIHAGLLLTGAEAGHPVQFVPELDLIPGPTLAEGLAWLALTRGMPRIIPPTGSRISIELGWKQDGKALRADARTWVREEKSGKPLVPTWVFAGSLLLADPITGKAIYAADEGDLITVANFASAILDLPLESSASDADRVFTANTSRLPPLGTEVLMILRPEGPGRQPDE